MMPDLDGWTVLAAIKGDPELADIPVILVTIVDEKNRGFALGATDYMVKPVDRARLSGVLRNICGAVGRQVLLVDDDEMMRRGMRQRARAGRLAGQPRRRTAGSRWRGSLKRGPTSSCSI